MATVTVTVTGRRSRSESTLLVGSSEPHHAAHWHAQNKYARSRCSKLGLGACAQASGSRDGPDGPGVLSCSPTPQPEACRPGPPSNPSYNHDSESWRIMMQPRCPGHSLAVTAVTGPGPARGSGCRHLPVAGHRPGQARSGQGYYSPKSRTMRAKRNKRSRANRTKVPK